MSPRNRQIRNRRNRRNPLLYVGAFTAFAAVLAGLYVLRIGPADVPAQGEPTVTDVVIGEDTDPVIGSALVDVPVADDTNSQIVTVYVDGWTMKILDRTKVKFRDSETRREADLDFVPLNAEGIDKAAAQHPEVFTDILSRMVSGDRRLKCTTDGCSAGGAAITPSMLAEPSQVPAFGKMYESWGINRGVWAAKIRVPVGSRVADFIADGYAGTSVIVGPTVAEGGEAITPKPDSGWSKNSYYIAASFGRLHLVLPAWRDTPGTEDAVRMVARNALGVRESQQDTLVEIAGRDPLSGGIGDLSALAAANGLNDYQLTYYSSPTTGCGAAALCVPGKISVKRSAVDVSDQLACNAEGTSVLIVSVRSTWTVKLPHTTHLAGVWGAGADPTAFDGSASMLSVLGYNGTPPLASGTKTFENLTWYAIDSLGLAVVAGSRAESADAIPMIDATMLDKLFGGIYSSCSK